MAKNKVFLMVLLALLAGFAVLIGCAEEGADNVSKSVDNSMSVSDNPAGDLLTESEALAEVFDEIGLPILNAEIKRRIQQQLWDEFVQRVEGGYLAGIESGQITMENFFHIPKYYGTYNGYVVIVPTNLSPMTMMWREVIDGIVFQDSFSIVFTWKGQRFTNIVCWKDNTFYTMTELYEQGELTRKDLLTIYDIQGKIKARPRGGW